jgi:hypothetical protein
MAQVGTGVVPIFATPFASLALEVPQGLNAELLRLFAARRTAAYRDPRAAPSALAFTSRDDVLDWPEAAVQRLRPELLGAVAAVVAAVTPYSEAEFEALHMQARGRFALVDPSGGIPVATYPMTAWCAVYCVAAPEQAGDRYDSGALRLYECRLQSSFIDASNWGLRAPFGHGHHLWHPKPGYLAVFPASHPHEIALNHGASVIALVMATVRFAAPAAKAAAP